MALLKTRYRIEGMDCGSCATKIETAARRLEGVAEVSVSVAGHSIVVEHDPETDLNALVKKVSGLGYVVSPAATAEAPTANQDNSDAVPPRCKACTARITPLPRVRGGVPLRAG